MCDFFVCFFLRKKFRKLFNDEKLTKTIHKRIAGSIWPKSWYNIKYNSESGLTFCVKNYSHKTITFVHYFCCNKRLISIKFKAWQNTHHIVSKYLVHQRNTKAANTKDFNIGPTNYRNSHHSHRNTIASIAPSFTAINVI